MSVCTYFTSEEGVGVIVSEFSNMTERQRQNNLDLLISTSSEEPAHYEGMQGLFIMIDTGGVIFLGKSDKVHMVNVLTKEELL